MSEDPIKKMRGYRSWELHYGESQKPEKRYCCHIDGPNEFVTGFGGTPLAAIDDAIKKFEEMTRIEVARAALGEH